MDTALERATFRSFRMGNHHPSASPTSDGAAPSQHNLDNRGGQEQRLSPEYEGNE